MMDKTEILSILISGFVLFVGAVSGYYHDPMDFARSGSALVVIAVLFTVFGVKRKLDDLLVTIIAKRFSVNSEHSLDVNNEEDKDLPEQLAKYCGKIKDEVSRRSLRALRVEAAILMVGTLIWGFGDLVYKII